MTETARLADYVLPAPTQFEKWEATFFNFDFPHNVFHLRKPVLPAPDGVLPEPEIHARLVEALGALTDADLAPLRAAAAVESAELRRGVLRGDRRRTRRSARSRRSCSTARSVRRCRTVRRRRRSCGVPRIGARRRFEASVRRAGFTGDGLALGEALFDGDPRRPQRRHVHRRRVGRRVAPASAPTTG